MISTDNQKELREESIYICRQLTGKQPDSVLIDKYIELHNFYFKAISDIESSFIRKIVTKNIPLEAIEYATRNKFPSLGKKINAMVYLMESCASYDGLFSDDNTNPIKAFLFLGWSALRTPFILVYGICLRIQHGLF